MNKYNVIFIGIDALRADHLGCYGYERPTSPHIDAIARKSFVFQNCFSQAPNTAPSFMSIFTSRYPSRNGIIDIANPQRDRGIRFYMLDEKVPTLAEILRNTGYRTAAFTWGANLSSVMGFDRGFEYYWEQQNIRGKWTCELPTSDILFWIREQRDQPFFLFLHTIAVHNPFDTPKRYQTRFGSNGKNPILDILATYHMERKMGQTKNSFLNRRINPDELATIKSYKSIYDGAIRCVDDFIGGLVEKLSVMRLRNHTVIVITSDHGDEFFEHGKLGHNQMYNEILRVPLIIYAPGLKPARITQIVRSIDIVPTALDLLKIRNKFAFQGTSLLPTLKKDLNLIAIAETETIGYAIQNKKFKYIAPRWKDYLERIDELYDLEFDPQETQNILFERPGVAEKLFAAYQDEVRRNNLGAARLKIKFLLKH